MYGVVAEAYALRKDADQVFAWLDRAVKNGEDVAGGLLSDPFLKPHWHDPRFAALCTRFGLRAPGEPSPTAASTL